jgi:hypothetical protein
MSGGFLAVGLNVAVGRAVGGVQVLGAVAVGRGFMFATVVDVGAVVVTGAETTDVAADAGLVVLATGPAVEVSALDTAAVSVA